MIYHFRILLEVVSLFAGAIITFNFYQQYKTSKNKFVLAIVFYLIFFNMINVGEIIVRYMKLNMFDIHSNLNAVHWEINRFLVMGGTTYTFYNIIYKLISKKLDLSFHLIFYSLAGIIAITHLGTAFEYYYTDGEIHFCNLEGLYAIPVLFILYALIILLSKIIKSGNQNSRKPLLLFVIFFLPGYGLYFIIIFFHNINYLIFPLITFYLNVAMYLWFNKYYRESIGISAFVNYNALIETIQRKYELTNREQEVIALVIEGKSNKQIEDALFISASTVKNHISIAYKKIGISSRGQLMNLILKLRDEN